MSRSYDDTIDRANECKEGCFDFHFCTSIRYDMEGPRMRFFQIPHSVFFVRLEFGSRCMGYNWIGRVWFYIYIYIHNYESHVEYIYVCVCVCDLI
jgi:hypothetical protein